MAALTFAMIRNTQQTTPSIYRAQLRLKAGESIFLVFLRQIRKMIDAHDTFGHGDRTFSKIASKTPRAADGVMIG
jgi:hypothetical protein